MATQPWAWQVMWDLKQYFKSFIFASLMIFTHQAISAERWLSLDYCSDYYLYHFIDAQNIVAVSDAFTDDNFSHIELKSKLEAHNNRLETIVALNPDKILLSSLTSVLLKEQLMRYGFDVVTLPYAQSWEAIKRNNLWFGTLANNQEATNMLNAKIDQAVTKMKEPSNQTALFVGSGDFAIYQGTHYDLILELLGFSHYDDDKQSFGSLNREEFIVNPADIIIQIQSLSMTVSQLGDLRGLRFLELLNKPPKRAKLPLSYSLCSSDQLIDAAKHIKEQLS